MGLKEAIIAATNAAFVAVGDIKTAVVYIQRISTYSTSTGAVANSDISINISGIIIPPGPIRKSISRDRDRTPINEVESRIIVKQTDLGSLTPKIKDLITIDSVNWTVEEISWDPAGATYTFRINRP